MSGKIEQRDAIEIYAGSRGHVVLTQATFGQEDSVVVIHPDDVETAIALIRAAREEALAIRSSPDFSPD